MANRNTKEQRSASISGKPNARHPQIREARIKQAMEWKLKGLPQKDIAALCNTTPITISNWTKEAAKNGWIEEIRDKISKTSLPLSEDMYTKILSADPAELTAKGIIKARELQLKAAKDVMHGMGVFYKHSPAVASVKGSLDIDGYIQLRTQREEAKKLERLRAENATATVEGTVLLAPAPEDQ